MTSATSWVVGVDGGATRTRALLADGAGRERGWIEGEPGLLGAGEDVAVAEAIARDVRSLAEAAGVELPLATLCAGLAGATGSPDSRRACEARLRALGVARRLTIVSDAEVAFLDAFGEASGILLLSGSGSVALARGATDAGHSRLLRVGGWGALLGDEGGAYRIALDGLRAAVAATEDRAPATRLRATLFAAVDATSLDTVFEWIGRARKSAVAGLAPIVVAAAEEGDAVAIRIVDDAVRALVGHADALRRRGVQPADSPEVAMAGGMLDPGRPLRARLASALAAEGYSVREEPVVPARGAVKLALRQA